VAEFNELARTWIQEEVCLRNPDFADLTLRQRAAFMTFDYFMSTGGEEEVGHLISYLTRALKTVATLYTDEPANN
jgi:hypothetical protein